MTLILARKEEGFIAVAADNMAALGNQIWTSSKLFPIGKNLVVGGAGNVKTLMPSLQHFQNKTHQKKDITPHKFAEVVEEHANVFDDEGEGDQWLLVYRGASVYYVDYQGGYLEIEDSFFAVGAGADVAVGAMGAGVKAIEAATIVCNHVLGCGRGISYLELSPLNPLGNLA